MAHTYMVFEFPNEAKAQEARHKLEGWKQAFRADKKVLVKFDRGDEPTADTAETADDHESEHAEEPRKGAKSKAPAAKSAKSTKSKKSDRSEEQHDDAAANSGPVKLLVRLYFSAHEKITEKQWLDRIPADDLFRVAHPHVINQKDATFDDTNKQFDTLE